MINDNERHETQSISKTASQMKATTARDSIAFDR